MACFVSDLNLPLALCMKRKFMMLSMMTTDPKQPGNDINVYLNPLIEDLNILWNEGLMCLMHLRMNISNCMQCYFALSMTSLHMETCQVIG